MFFFFVSVILKIESDITKKSDLKSHSKSVKLPCWYRAMKNGPVEVI